MPTRLFCHFCAIALIEIIFVFFANTMFPDSINAIPIFTTVGV